jgi:hypothetical protein
MCMDKYTCIYVHTHVCVCVCVYIAAGAQTSAPSTVDALDLSSPQSLSPVSSMRRQPLWGDQVCLNPKP